MRKLFPLSVLTALAACSEPTTVAPPTQEAALSARSADVAVTTHLLGGGASPALSIQSDQLGAYVNNSQGVVSIIQGVGDWLLDLTGRKSTRKAYVDFGMPLAGNPGAAPFTSGLVAARIIARPTQVGATFPGMRGLGSTMLSPLSLAFTHGGKEYGVRMNSNNHPATDWALVTCTRVADPVNPATSSCTGWELTPNGSYDGVTQNVGRLEQVTSSGPIFIGYYYFTFDIAFAR